DTGYLRRLPGDVRVARRGPEAERGVPPCGQRCPVRGRRPGAGHHPWGRGAERRAGGAGGESRAVRSSGKGERRVGGSTVGLITSLAVHGGLIAFLGGVVESAEPSPPVYAVELVAAPAPAPKQRLAPEATPTPPPPEPPAPEKSTPEPDVPSVPVKEPDRPIEPRPRADPAPKTSAPETPAPGETPSTGRDATTIS